jgi:photosystem II stability/assembly factor-like uncharacterized protein
VVSFTNDYDTAFRSISAIDTNHIWTCGIPGGVYKTENGGATWTRVKIIEFNRLRTDYILSVNFVDKSNGWAAGSIFNKSATDQEGVIYGTTDGGNTWHKLPPIQGEKRFFNISFVTPNEGWIFATNNIYRTVDGGVSWQLSLSLNNN